MRVYLTQIKIIQRNDIIKTVIHKKNSKVTSGELIINDSTVSDEKIIAENFYKFYVNIGSNLCKKIPHVERHPTSYIKQTNHMSIFINKLMTMN